MNMHDIFINAILADAAYAKDLKAGLEETALKEKLLGRMTPVLAELIGNDFKIISHMESDDIVGSGFDATIWEPKSTNKVYISFQGTFGVKNIAVDQNGQAPDYRVFAGAGAGRHSGELA